MRRQRLDIIGRQGMKIAYQAGMLALCLGVAVQFTFAQNVAFTQYRVAPLYMNPSFLAMKSEASLSFINRGQQLTGDVNFNTTAFSGTYALLNKDSRRLGGVGISAIRDVFVGDESFKLQGIATGAAYNLMLKKQQYLAFGMQLGYFNRSANFDRFSTGSQWVENVGYDEDAGLGENFENQQKSYLSMGAGLNYYVEDAEGRNIATLGLGSLHMNQPSVSLLNTEDQLPMRFMANGYMALLKTDKLLLGPEIIYVRQSEASLLSPGASFSYFIKNDNPFNALKEGRLDLKARYAIDNALIAMVQLHQPNFSVGFSYDFGLVANRKLTAGRNATEIAFTIRKLLGRKNRPEKVVVDDYTLGEVRDFYEKEEPLRYFGNEGIGDSDSQEGDEKIEYNWKGENYQFELRKDFNFGFNQSELSDQAKVFLDDLIKLLQDNKRLSLEVIGHTDNVGSAQANHRLSIARAAAVVKYLTFKEVDANRLKTTGRSDTEPLVPNNTDANRSKNRRVEFIIYTK